MAETVVEKRQYPCNTLEQARRSRHQLGVDFAEGRIGGDDYVLALGKLMDVIERFEARR